MVVFRWGTFTTGGHLVVFRWAFGSIWVGNTFTTGGHLVAFRWAFGGIQVGI